MKRPASRVILTLCLAALVLWGWAAAQTGPPPSEEGSPSGSAADEDPAGEDDWGRLRTIVLDPGHGGEEVGAVGRSGLYEKDLALDITRRLAERLRSRQGMKVILTRSIDVAVPLRERTAIANNASADLFISIHLNSSRRTSAHGTETYFLSLTASDEEAMSLARAENRGGTRHTPGQGGEEGEGEDEGSSDLDMVLWGLAQSEHLAMSSRLADLIQNEMNRLLGVDSRGIKQAPFTVLMGATMPAVLVEVAFLSNKDEEAKLESGDFRDRVAVAMESAITRFKDELERARLSSLSGSRP